MAQEPSKEGTIPFTISSLDIPCFTYYKVFGDLSCGAPPVVVLHGGPGAGHEYLLPFAELWPQYGLPVVFYDQIGCGGSTHLPQTVGDKKFWQEELFIAELDNVLDQLALRDGPGFHLLGQSWGGMLAANFTARRPRGLQRVVLASALASRELAQKGMRLLREQMPAETRQAFDEAEQKEEYDSAAYRAGLDVFYTKHLCRAEPFPPAELLPAFKNLSESDGGKTVYSTMYGPSPLTNNGSLSAWTSIPNLPRISAPALVYNGEHDSSHDIATVPFFELIPRVRWITFANGGHMCHVEGELRQKILAVVGEFLQQHSAK